MLIAKMTKPKITQPRSQGLSFPAPALGGEVENYYLGLGLLKLGPFFYFSIINSVLLLTSKPSGEPQDVFLKIACGPSPSVKRFFVLLYM